MKNAVAYFYALKYSLLSEIFESIPSKVVQKVSRKVSKTPFFYPLQNTSKIVLWKF